MALSQASSRLSSRETRKLRVGFVVQRCGNEVNGGAESLCLQIAQRMARHWRTEIITTCALDYVSWDNFYPEGVEQVGPTEVRRFRVDHQREIEKFDRLSAELHPKRSTASLQEQEGWMRAQGPMSSGLLEYLRAERESYDAFIFFGYLYATTYFGLPLVRDRAWLEPLAHDEWTIYFNMWDDFFALPKGLIFNTEAESNLVQTRFRGTNLDGPVVGIGIEAPAKVRSQEFRQHYNLTSPFLLYVGRIDESKGCASMFEFFLRWKQESGATYKLVLLGREVLPVPFHDDIIHLGFVEEEEKWAAMQSCDWLLMPSPYESLSIVLLETWSVGRPALVNGASAVLAAHCRESNGGLCYTNFEEWSMSLNSIDEATRDTLGRQGRAYVRARYTWDRVESTYLDALRCQP
jgi:glycosyltransferase involved in cell wall biosynthesis